MEGESKLDFLFGLGAKDEATGGKIKDYIAI